MMARRIGTGEGINAKKPLTLGLAKFRNPRVSGKLLFLTPLRHKDN